MTPEVCPSLQVTGYYDLLEEFGIQAPAEDLAAAACLDADYASLRDTTWAAEAAKERYAEAFRAQLEQQAAELAKEVAQLRVEGEQEVFLVESQGGLGRGIKSAASAKPSWPTPGEFAPCTAGCSTCPAPMQRRCALVAVASWAPSHVSWRQALQSDCNGFSRDLILHDMHGSSVKPTLLVPELSACMQIVRQNFSMCSLSQLGTHPAIAH